MCKMTNDKLKEMLSVKDIDTMASVTVEDSDVNDSSELIYSINAYQYLNSQLDLDDKFCKRVNDKLNEIRDIADEDRRVEYPHWDSECMSVVENMLDAEIEEISNVSQVNTYNYDSNLSHVLQYTQFTYDKEDEQTEYYCMLSVHLGGDVRGNYSNAVLFRIDNDWGEFLKPEDVRGYIGGVAVDNMHNGYSLTDEDGDDVEINQDTEIELYIMGE